MSRNALFRFENGTKEPMYTVVVNLAELFGVSADYFIGMTDNDTDK